MELERAKRLMSEHQHIILFDGVCNLCSAWVEFVVKRDPSSRFHFCSVQSDTGRALLMSNGLPTDSFDTMVYIRHGNVFVRSSAFLEIVKKLPLLWPCLSLALYVPRVIRDTCYNMIAKNRYRLWGKKEQCMVPSAEIKKRFI